MRIAYLCHLPAFGLADDSALRPGRSRAAHPVSWVRNLSACIPRIAGDELRVFVLSRDVTRAVAVRMGEAEVHFIPKPYPGHLDPVPGCWFASRVLWRHVQAWDPHVVVGFGAEGLYGWLAGRSRAPGVLFIQGIQAFNGPFYDFSRLRIRLRTGFERVTVRGVSGALAETGFASRWFSGVRPDAPVAIVPHPVSAEFLEARPTHERPRLLCVGSLIRLKGVDAVLDAYRRCKEPGELHFIGGGPWKERMARAIADAGLGGRAVLRGHLSHAEILGEMAVARGVVLGSRMDVSPNVLTEAHAAGLPVIGTRAGGIPEMIDDGADGFLVDVDDTSTMARRMDLLLADRTLAQRMGAAGRAKVAVLNDPMRVSGLHVEFYRRVVEASRPAG